MNFVSIASRLPGIEEPKTHLSFKSRLKWTGLILVLFIVLSHITLVGVAPEERQRFQFFELILGSSIGTLMTLGIGPIVTASIILQLLVGSKIIPWNLQDPDGKRKFQSAQKLLVIFFCVFEAFAYVSFGAIRPASVDMMPLLIAQIAFGGYLVLLMDEVISKWGIGSGVSLFIAENVSRTIFVRAFNPITPLGETIPAGLIPQSIAFIGLGDLFQAFLAWIPILATIIVFLTVVYLQAMKVEIPLAFGSIRGFGRRWPLNLIYTSNMPVILIAALLANLQLVGTMVARPDETGLRCGFLGCFDQNNNAISGVSQFFQPVRSVSTEIFFLVLLGVIFIAAFSSFYFKFKHGTKALAVSAVAGILLAIIISSSTVGLPTGGEFARAGAYALILVAGSVVFSIFWVSTSGMDSKSVAGQIEGLGMQIPGFRRDPRIIEQVLDRYIPTLAIISGLFIGILAAMADFTGALGTGTGILLTVMIIYNLYENIASRYMQDMHPAMRKFFG